MHMTIGEASDFVAKFLPLVPNDPALTVILAPPFTALHSVHSLLAGRDIHVAAQDMHWEDRGPYTGEISPRLIVDAGCRYVLLGHSERRVHFGETSENIRRKVSAAFRYGLIPLLCVGETALERQEGRSCSRVESQLVIECADLVPEQGQDLIIAYEPVWAIGSGHTATRDQIREMHLFIRDTMSKLLGQGVASSLKILYGGSVTPDHIAGLGGVVDGVLVGGQSLSVDSFTAIVREMVTCIHS
jgi:triosephosphate isomerase